MPIDWRRERKVLSDTVDDLFALTRNLAIIAVIYYAWTKTHDSMIAGLVLILSFGILLQLGFHMMPPISALCFNRFGNTRFGKFCAIWVTMAVAGSLGLLAASFIGRLVVDLVKAH